MEERQLLRDESVFPESEVIAQAIGESYPVYEQFLKEVVEEYGLSLEWRYYNDGKSWLGKVTFKKKTILWLSVWEGFFRTSFFFTEKTMEGVLALDIAQGIKEEFCLSKPVGKLIPLILSLNHSEQIDDLKAIVDYKKKLK